MEVHPDMLQYARDIRDSGEEVNLREFLKHEYKLSRILVPVGITFIGCLGGLVSSTILENPNYGAQAGLLVASTGVGKVLYDMVFTETQGNRIRRSAELVRKNRQSIPQLSD